MYEVVYRHNKEHKLLSEIYTLMSAKLQEVTRNNLPEGHEGFTQMSAQYQEFTRNRLAEWRHRYWKFVGETLIVCNQPDHFEKLMKELDPKLWCICGSRRCGQGSLEGLHIYNCFCCNCKLTCKILHRQECERVLDRYCRSETIKRLNEEHVGLNETTDLNQKYLPEQLERSGPCDFEDNNIFTAVKKRSFMYLLQEHPYSKNEIQDSCKQLIPNINHAINLPLANGVTPLQLYICNKMNIKAVKVLVENVSDVENEFFTYILKTMKYGQRNTKFEYRRVLEQFIHSNPSLDED